MARARRASGAVVARMLRPKRRRPGERMRRGVCRRVKEYRTGAARELGFFRPSVSKPDMNRVGSADNADVHHPQKRQGRRRRWADW